MRPRQTMNGNATTRIDLVESLNLKLDHSAPTVYHRSRVVEHRETNIALGYYLVSTWLSSLATIGCRVAGKRSRESGVGHYLIRQVINLNLLTPHPPLITYPPSSSEAFSVTTACVHA
jgi:hypothetical protein